MEIKAATKTVTKTVCTQQATYRDDGGKSVFVPAEYVDKTETIDLFIVFDGVDYHEFATMDDAKAFTEGKK